MAIDKQALRKRALLLAEAGGKNVAAALVAEFHISRQAANRHLMQLVKDGDIVPSGLTKARIYQAAIKQEAGQLFPREGLAEDLVWRSIGAPVVKDLPENVRDIWHYGMTEMINNAIDHSGSPGIRVAIRRTALHTFGLVADDGEGIFLKIQRALGLADPRESILELAKGKLTTDPKNHTGEGIFFSSKMFDSFTIFSGNLRFLHDDGSRGFLMEHPADAPGTFVCMELANDSTRTPNDVFYQYAAPDELSFDKTVVPVRLAQYEGEKLVSRSQAKRLTARLEKFKTVILDFTGVESIGQGFADELFRVFAAAHPALDLVPMHMTTAVQDMTNRILAGRDMKQVLP
ncbi:MAG: ArsR family transcriptional regulator [Rhodocyclales bacterium RIFCSPLOWO2_02_FULL_63_24]|nr:MAG: ArsR family transcriptional regulator [Rhodocyclales bacterium RIFCSPLOWO2_02_FULL_63_24]